jgi:hypothetical protein
VLLRVAACAALLSGCASTPSPEDDGPRPREESAMLEVDNRAFQDMTVYVLDGGQRVRLGIAKGNGVTTLVIPRYLVQSGKSLQFLCDPIGGSRTPVSDEIMVEPGDHVTLLIPGG